MAVDGTVVFFGFTVLLSFATVVALLFACCAGAAFIAFGSGASCSSSGGSGAGGAAPLGAPCRGPADRARQAPCLAALPGPPQPRPCPARGGRAPSAEAGAGEGAPPRVVYLELLRRQPKLPLAAELAGERQRGRAAAFGRLPSGGSGNSSTITDISEVEELLRGYASQLACLFGGNVDFHGKNVAAVVNAYGLEGDDVCYCFLCLEQVSIRSTGADLALKRHGLGQYTARVWTATLARFVSAAQGLANALREDHLRLPCEAWGYELLEFSGDVVSCEAVFKRRYACTLTQAFLQEGVRRAEVLRAQLLLATLGRGSAGRAGQVAASAAMGNMLFDRASATTALSGSEPMRKRLRA